MKTPVLFLIFNRPDTTKKVFEQIKIAKPPKLYIAQDGARNESEKQIVDSVREFVLNSIDWKCVVHTKFSQENMGCGRAIASSLDRFFSCEKEGIILEDDCVPSQSFFRFCEELLEKYRDDKRIWHISGTGYYKGNNTKESYYFAKIMHCWGWASWADRWKEYEFNLSSFDEKTIEKFSTRKDVKAYYKRVLKYLKRDDIDTWDYQWAFKIVEKGGFCINPYKNLVSNIGNYGAHYKGDNEFANFPAFELDEIVHPKKIELNKKAMNYIYTHVYKISVIKSLIYFFRDNNFQLILKLIEELKKLNDFLSKKIK